MGVRRFRQFLAEPTLVKVPNGSEPSNAKDVGTVQSDAEIVITVSIPQTAQLEEVIKVLKRLAADLSTAYCPD
jgi:hypothetical protein